MQKSIRLLLTLFILPLSALAQNTTPMDSMLVPDSIPRLDTKIYDSPKNHDSIPMAIAKDPTFQKDSTLAQDSTLINDSIQVQNSIINKDSTLAIDSITLPEEMLAKNNDLIKENLYGKVKTVGIIDSSISPITETIYKYNDKGLLIEKNFYDYTEKINKKIFYKHDTKGNKIEEGFEPYPSRKLFVVRYSWKYDKDGNKIEEYWHGHDSILYKNFSYKYYNGKIIEEKAFYLNRLITVTSYRYDEQGNQTEKIEKDDKGILRNRNVYEYNKKGQCIQELFYLEKDTAHSKKYTYQYDKQGNMIEQIDHAMYKRKNTWKYDNNNRLIEEGKFNLYVGKGSKITYKYENYNVEGNWQRQLKFISPDAKPIIIERIIEYY